MKYQRILFLSIVLIAGLYAAGQPVESFLTTGTLPVEKPLFLQGKNVKGEAFEDQMALSHAYLDLRNLVPENGKILLWSDLRPRTWMLQEAGEEGHIEIEPERKHPYQIAYAAFYLESAGLYTRQLEVESNQMFEVFLDGKKVGHNYTLADTAGPVRKTSSLEVDRGKFLVLIKSMFVKEDEHDWILRARIKADSSSTAMLSTDPATGMNIHHLLEGTKIQGASLSPDGKLMMLSYRRVNTESGQYHRWIEIREVATGRIRQSFHKEGASGYRWMPRGSKLHYQLEDEFGETVWVYDLENGVEYAALRNVKGLAGPWWPSDEAYLIYGLKETRDNNEQSSLQYADELANRTFQARSATSLYHYNLSTGVSTRLTWSEVSTTLHDISPTGNRILFSTTRPNPTQRPFTLQNMYELNLDTRQTDTLWKDFRWAGSCAYSPDGRQLMVLGGPDLFGEKGRNIGDQELANNYDIQLYLYDLETHEVSPIGAEFDPSIISAHWHALDNRIYLLTMDEIYQRIHAWDSDSLDFYDLGAVPEVVTSVGYARNDPKAVYLGNQLGLPPKAWIVDLDSITHRLVDSTEEDTYRHVRFANSEEWDFLTGAGDSIRGYFLYPLDFDPEKKYPLIVNYYGGTNPIEKAFGGRYPLDIWAGAGYVVYVPQPSGAKGFGQEFSARHQNDWGRTSALEIIEGTRKFIAAHEFVDSTRVGCIGASYGGFMTMYLQTLTDLFTCAISHAGISSLSSYWGEGYWGYLYSSEASGGSFPWNNRDLYINQGSLFNADKINTPLLLLHGDEDTNVPVGESIQLWVGLKILGKPVEMVLVEGENHWILTYSKRIEWHNTIMAWFDKWLKDQDHDWKKLFPESKL